MTKYDVTFYEFGSIQVEAETVKEAEKKTLNRAKQIFKPEVIKELEIACIEII